MARRASNIGGNVITKSAIVRHIIYYDTWGENDTIASRIPGGPAALQGYYERILVWLNGWDKFQAHPLEMSDLTTPPQTTFGALAGNIGRAYAKDNDGIYDQTS
ncbi:MAG: hypothetical protein ABR863_04355 [Roseiarcus sp.]|jgi:hypothetical protein